MDLNWCKQPEIGLPKPDLVLYFELDAGQAAARAQYGGERYEKKEFQARVAENYLRLREQDWKVGRNKNVLSSLALRGTK